MSRLDTFLHQLTLANQLTLLRLAAVPALAYALLSHELGWALGIFIAAGITDRLDGIAARRLGQQTRLGAILDPTADKLMMLATFVILALPQPLRAFPEFILVYRVPVWFTFLVVARDILIVVVALGLYLSYGQNDFPPLRIGKWTTGFEMVTAGLFLLANLWPKVPGALLSFAVVATSALLVASGVGYLLRTTRHQRGRIEEDPP